jgi:hypothetical protein
VSASRTTLVVDRTFVPELTGTQEADARGALVRALIEYLQGLTYDAPGGRRSRLEQAVATWADPEDSADYPSIGVFTPGEALYDPAGFTPVVRQGTRVSLQDGGFGFLAERAEIQQELRVEVHCTDREQRSALSAAIEGALWPVDWMSGFRLRMPHYHGAVGVYEPVASSWEDSSVASAKRVRIAVFRILARGPVVLLRRVPELQPRAAITVQESPVSP